METVASVQVPTMRSLFVMLAFTQWLHQVVNAFNCRPEDCAEIQCYNGDLKNGGPYVIYPDKYSSAYANCVADVSGGGWTVMLRRAGGQLTFRQRWREYKFGFGSFGPDSETWLGNEYVYQMSTKRNKELTMRVDAVSADDRTMTIVMRRVALLGEGQDYTLILNGTETLQGVSTNDFRDHNRQRFSTSDHDNSEGGFSEYYGGGGWWFANNTSIYLSGAYWRAGENETDKTYMTAASFDGLRQLKSSRILIRPSSFTTVSASCTNPCTNGGTCEYAPQEKTSYCVCQERTCGVTCQSRTGCDTTTTATTTERVTLPSKDFTEETTKYADKDYEVDGATSHISFTIAVIIMTVICVIVYVNACFTVWNIYKQSRRARDSDASTKRRGSTHHKKRGRGEKDGRKRVEREEELEEEEEEGEEQPEHDEASRQEEPAPSDATSQQLNVGDVITH